MPQAEPLRAGDPAGVGPYRFVGRLGAGGQGVVYLGQAPDGRLVAVKVLQDGLAGDAGFAKEIAAARRVEPFCIAQVLDVSVTGRPYIVTEYVEGPSLQQAGRHTGADLQRLAVATATALAAIHQAGVVHRDFKPANVLLGPGGPRVIDFGIARTTDAAATVTSAVIGTPAYMAPEQLGGQQIGPAADVFAWASVIVFAATGTPPFGNDTLPAIINRILNNEPQLGDLPGQALRSIVYRCLDKDPLRRPAMRDVLLHLLGGQEQQQATAPGRAAGRRRAPSSGRVNVPLVAGGAVAGVVALVAGVVWLVPQTGLLAAPSGTATNSPGSVTSAEVATPPPRRTRKPPKSTPKPTRKPTPKPTRTRTQEPAPTPRRTTEQPTPTPARTTKKPATKGTFRIISAEVQGWPKTATSDCYDEFLAFAATVEANKPSLSFSYAWVLDGKRVARGTSGIAGDGYTGTVPSQGHLLKPGNHTVTFQLTSPVSSSRTVNFSVCPLE
ncbi:serine/threonine-protein kinase [Streptosporangium sp. KLBMP 9127]|nr:serine/threonine protein kinase [Streptosporangium sp. KLBMP 9127]